MMLAWRDALEAAVPEQPGCFASLMELYERNYIQLRRLAPVLPVASASRISRRPGALDLHLHSLEHGRYTSDLILTYRFHQDSGNDLAEPDLRIRVYHDARLAEAHSTHPRHPLLTVRDAPRRDHPAASQLLTRWRLNRFLDRWLAYCLGQGHRFHPEDAASV